MKRHPEPEISIFQTGKQRDVCTRIQLLLVLLSLVSSLFIVIALADGSNNRVNAFNLSCEKAKAAQGRSE